MIFLQACLLGVLLGMIYDCFRVFREIVPCKKTATFIQDLLFFGIVTLCTLVFWVGVNKGQLRFYLVIGEGLGAWLYFQSISRIVFWAIFRVIRLIKRFLRFLFRPVKRLFSRFWSFIQKKIPHWKQKKKNICEKPLSLLKKPSRIVYNKKNDTKKGRGFLWQRKGKPKV